MRRLAYLCVWIIVFCGATTHPVLAQQAGYTQTREKVYIQTSHVFFKQGETMFFKIYVMNALKQTPSAVSNTVYVEILNPAGNVLQSVKYPIADGYAEGSFDIADQAVGGVYKIRVYTAWMRNENESAWFTREFTVQKVIAPRILMRLDFPEKGYGPGSEVKADFSMRNLKDESISFYPARYSASVGGKPVLKGSVITDREGKARLKFRLPEDLSSTDGLLNITVDYESYTESVSRAIPIVLNKIDLQFMPEGGSLVDGIPTNLAFKAINEFGKATDVTGEIIDSRGHRVARFESYHFGMGRFPFTPHFGEVYRAKILSPANIREEYSLPGCTLSGVVMNFGRDNGMITVNLRTTGPRSVRLVGVSRGVEYYSSEIALQNGDNPVSIREDIFPVGITQFTLYAGDLPLAERLMFLNEKRNLRVMLSTDKERYLPREKVRLTITSLDENGRPVPSNFSLAVVDDKLWSFADDKQDHILSWILLNSELKGHVEEPQFYFKKDEPRAKTALDLVMMTNGYRYFDFVDYVIREGRLRYSPGEENVISGVVVNSLGQPIKAKVYLVKSASMADGIEVSTDESGTFTFTRVEPGTNYYLIARALTRAKGVSINIGENGLRDDRVGNSLLKNMSGRELAFIGLARQPGLPGAKANLVDLPASGEKRLEEVVVTGYGVQLKKEVTGSVSYISSRRLDLGLTLGYQLEGRVAGVQVFQKANPGADPAIVIRGTRTINGESRPLFVVNGIPVQELDLNTLNPYDISNVTVLKDAEAVALYGSQASFGVIIIELKNYRNARWRRDFNTGYNYMSRLITATGTPFAVPKRFYVPKYASVVTEERTDFRETIYWNPVVQTDKNGRAEVEYYNSDAATTFRAIAEGIAWNGKLGRAEVTYASQPAMRVDAKIPPYLTVGDKARIPLFIKNNTTEELKVSITVAVPAGFTTTDTLRRLQLAPDSSCQLQIPVEAGSRSEGTIRFIVINQFGKEIISLPISAADKGFPVYETCSGDRDKQYEFNVRDLVPGTLRARLQVFKNLEGQLLNGIESMIREPYGCFEQTSSSTYPNIFVLRYLKESGRSNPEIEQKALGYIKQGYKRLIGFETSQNGFEWFGHAPAHEALTAYGLLEFTDMKEFVEVDERMLARTRDFLLKRRDGNGSFKIASGGYDRFASVPDRIAHIYIVYAMTRAGFGSDIRPEYDAAVKKAIQSNDGYMMAMMALSASYMKNEDDFRTLMKALRKLFQGGELQSETSVVNSHDASLRVEAFSLFAQALMREDSPDLGLIGKLLTRVLAEKSYYGYGSTQATVLALQTIVEYYRLVGRLSGDSPVAFAMNDKPVAPDSDVKNFLQPGNNRFTVAYPEPGKNYPYELEISYNTYLPRSSEKAALSLKTILQRDHARVGETVRMDIAVTNTRDMLQPMAIAKVGIPAGLSVQPWQLKELMEKNEFSYYEIFDNYLVFYWMGFAVGETKTIHLDLKADVPGVYKAKASSVYLYYTPEQKCWAEGTWVELE